jgi:hypothetical protein
MLSCLCLQDGKYLHKKNTFTDFIACAEHLIKVWELRLRTWGFCLTSLLRAWRAWNACLEEARRAITVLPGQGHLPLAALVTGAASSTRYGSSRQCHYPVLPRCIMPLLLWETCPLGTLPIMLG